MSDKSQHGESLYLNSLFPENYIGTCVEIGAYNGIECSNTYLFENKGWNCMCIEPIPEQYLKCKESRKLALQYAVSSEDKDNVAFTIFTLCGNNQSAISGLSIDEKLVKSHEHLIQGTQKISVECRTITRLLDEHKYPEQIDIMSIDTEGTELDVLKGLDFDKYKIRVFVIENNHNEPYCEEYLKIYGYKKINRIAVNDFFYFGEYFYQKYHGEIQNGLHIDQVLREYFPDPLYQGVFFDIGAFEPVRISNSYHFEKNNWKVYCFEANTDLIPLLKEYRKNVFNYAISNENKELVEFNIVNSGHWTAGYSAINISEEYKKIFGWNNSYNVKKISVPQKTLNEIIEKEIPDIEKIDIISLDIEGGELNCLYGLDLKKYKPRVMVIENANHSKVITEYLESYNYKLDKVVSYNEYYILKDF